jgi:uncharacterized repeat protein (TIGR03803 family)
MDRLSGWKTASFIVALWATTGIASQAQTLTTLVTFDITNGAYPYGTLVQGLDGNFYGTTANGGKQQCLGGCGTIFKVTPEGTLTTVHSFLGVKHDGGNPMAGLVLGTNGNFYGSTYGSSPQACCGGSGSYFFELTPDGTFANLVSTGGSLVPLIQDTIDGNFYGTIDGVRGGFVFKMTPTGTLTGLHDFCQLKNCVDGADPTAPLVQGADGFLYGTTRFGGIIPTTGPCGGTGCGTVFKIGTKGSTAILHKFDVTDGEFPSSGLTVGNDGDLYGATGSGQTTVFKISPAGAFTTLYNCGPCGGIYPALGSMVLGSDGNFYGTTVGGAGTIFQVTPGGDLTTLYGFEGVNHPYGGLVQGTDGNFYGTTTGSVGAHAYGTVYKLSLGLPPFVKTVLAAAYPGTKIFILGTNLTGATAVNFGDKAAAFTVVSATEIIATVPKDPCMVTVQVVTPSGTLSSNITFRVF